MPAILRYGISGLFVLAMSMGVVAVTQQEQQEGNQEATAAQAPERLATPAKPQNSATNRPSYEVALEVDGLLLGEVIGLDPETGVPTRLANMAVAFARDGVMIARARTDDAGRFQAAGLEPGVYSMLVASATDVDANGPNANLRGLAAMGIRVLPNQVVAQSDGDSAVRFSGMLQGGNVFTVPVISRTDFPLLMDMAGASGLQPVVAAGAPGAGATTGAATGGGGAAGAVGGGFPAAGFAPPGGGSSAPGFAGDLSPDLATSAEQ